MLFPDGKHGCAALGAILPLPLPFFTNECQQKSYYVAKVTLQKIKV